MSKKFFCLAICLFLFASFTGCADKTENKDAATLLTEVKTTQYFSDEKITDGDIEKILSAGINAPSAMNTQPWHFTAITDKETTQKLADAMGSMKPPAGMMEGKSGMPKGERPEIPDGEMPKMPNGEKPENMPTPPKGDFGGENKGKPGFFQGGKKAGIGDAPLTIVISCEEGAELSAGLAVQNMSAEAQLLGYGTKILTSPVMALNGENKEEYKSLLKIPENQKVASVLIVGKPAEDSENPDATASATTRSTFESVATIIGE